MLAVIQRVLLSALVTAMLLALASAALFVTTAPAPISLLLEPFSLLLLPGTLISLCFVGSHSEVSATDVLLAAACFYFVAIFLISLRASPPPRTHSLSR